MRTRIQNIPEADECVADLRIDDGDDQTCQGFPHQSKTIQQILLVPCNDTFVYESIRLRNQPNVAI